MMKHWQYLKYLVRHKWYVLVAGRAATKTPLWRLLIHDWSKFLPSEWRPYADFFYGTPRVGERISGLVDGLPFIGRVSRYGSVAGNIVIEQPINGMTWHLPLASLKRPDAKEAFDRAWLAHQHRNPHHWQHWILREDSGAVKALEMPDHFIREMLADWMGAGRAISGHWEPLEWYEKNKAKIVMGPNTRIRVEQILHDLEALVEAWNNEPR